MANSKESSPWIGQRIFNAVVDKVLGPGKEPSREDSVENPAAFLTRSTTRMGQRLYVYLKHQNPSLLQAHQTMVTFKPEGVSARPVQIPVYLILSMLLPIVNSREDRKKVCDYAVLATQTLMEYLLNSTYWDDVNSSYYTRLSWVLLSLNGAIEELILLIKRECLTGKSCIGFDKPLQSPPPIAESPALTVAKAAGDMCPRFTSVTQQFLWLCVAHAATNSIKGKLNVQRTLLEGMSKESPLRGVGEAIIAVSGEKRIHLLTHVVCLYSRRPHCERWERAFTDYLKHLVNNLPSVEANGMKLLIHSTLQSSKDENTERSYGMPKDMLITELNKCIQMFFLSRRPTTREASVNECGLQFGKWWPIVQNTPVDGSLLALMFTKYPQTQRNWATPVGLILTSEMFGNAISDKVSTEYFAVALHSLIFTRVGLQSDSMSNMLQGQIVSESLENTSKASKFVRLLKTTQVLEAIRKNPRALSFINSHLPTVLKKINVSRGYLLIDSDDLMKILSPDIYPQVVEFEAPRADDSWAFLETLGTATWSEKVQFPFAVPTDSKLQLPDKLASKTDFMKFSFDDELPFISLDTTTNKGSVMLSAASWAWLNTLSKMTSLAARQLCKYVTDLDKLSNQAISESNLHNVFKLSLLLDSLLCNGSRSMPYDHVKVPATTFTDLSKTLYHLMDCLESNADFPACQPLSDEKTFRALYPFHCEVRSVEEEIHQTAKKLGEGGLPEFIFKSTPKQVDEYFIKCAEKGAGVSEKGKKALDHLRSSHAQAIGMISSMREGINESSLILSWLTKVRKDLYKIKAEERNTIVFPEISQQMQEGEAAMKALKAEESVHNSMRTKAVLETLDRALFKGVAANAKQCITILLLDPIRKDAPYSALFHGFFMQFAVHCDSIGEALTEALSILEDYIADPFRPDDKEKYLYVTKVDVTAEMALLRTWRRSTHEDDSLEVVQNTLEAIQVREIMGTARKLLIAEGLPKKDYGPSWTGKDVQSALGRVNAETLRIWRAVIGMQSIVKAVIEVMEVANLNQYIGANVSKREIKATCIPMLSNQIGSILTRMRGLGSDASYDVLVAFNHYVSFVSALILSAGNDSFTLASRLQFLEGFPIDHNATKDEAIKMLNENLGEVVRIVEVQGSTTETGRIKMELSRVQKDLNACIAVCICSKNTVISQESSAFQNQNLSVRLLTTNNGGVITVSQSDDELVAFEERVVMLENEEKANTFSEAWRLATDLLELLAHAEWLGLRKGSLQLHKDQQRSIAALPDPSIDNVGSFYIYSVPVNSISQTERTIQAALKKQLDAFIGEQSAIRDRNQWALAFPRRIANDAIDAKERGLPLSRNLQGEMAFVLSDLEVVPTDNSAKLGIDVNNAMDNLSKAKSLGRRRVDILWYSSTNADEDNTATSEVFQPVYFGEAMRFAMERHSWNPCHSTYFGALPGHPFMMLKGF